MMENIARELLKVAKELVAKKDIPVGFNDVMRSLGFGRSRDEYEMRNRNLAYEDMEPNCDYDDEYDQEACMDQFYDDASDDFNRWAHPIERKVEKAAKDFGVVVEVESSAEYGTLTVTVERVR